MKSASYLMGRSIYNRSMMQRPFTIGSIFRIDICQSFFRQRKHAMHAELRMEWRTKAQLAYFCRFSTFLTSRIIIPADP